MPHQQLRRTPDDRPTLDDLYWNTALPTGEIAVRLGLPGIRLHTRVTPLDAGLGCYRCRTALTYSSRSQRDGARPTCPRCGCSRRDPAGARPDRAVRAVPAAAGGVVVVLDDGGDIGWEIEGSADALAAAGMRWSGDLVLVDAAAPDPSAAIVGAARSRDPGVLAVDSLAALGATQAERLQTLFTLTHMRWRVVSASPVHVERPRRPIAARDLDELDDEPPMPYELGFASRLVEATSRAGVRRCWW